MIKAWLENFGEEYRERNRYDWRKRVPMFREILKDLPIESILEVGSNIGLNLESLADLGYIYLMGIEPNETSAKESRFPTKIGTAKKIPINSDYFNLVFTCGVLIHVPPDELEQSMKEIIRVSNRYVLAIEYEASRETMVKYRGQRDMLWKRPYGKLYKQLGLKLIKEGKTDIKCRYWLFEKA